MKAIIPLCLVASLLTLGTISCKEKKKSEDIIVAKYVPEQLKDPIRLPVDERRTEVKWQNSFYTVITKRVAADSLPLLTDESGQQYVDNSVSVIIQRGDGSLFLNKTFVKETFSCCVDEKFRKRGYLENIIFQGVEDGYLKFGAAVSRPGSEDEFVPIDLFIDRQGGLRISQGRLFDNSDNSVEEEGV